MQRRGEKVLRVAKGVIVGQLGDWAKGSGLQKMVVKNFRHEHTKILRGAADTLATPLFRPMEHAKERRRECVETGMTMKVMISKEKMAKLKIRKWFCSYGVESFLA